jgi:hypothetical protein
METISGCWRRSSGPKLDLTEAAVATPLTEFTSGCACRLKPGQYQVQYHIVCLCIQLLVLRSHEQTHSEQDHRHSIGTILLQVQQSLAFFINQA